MYYSNAVLQTQQCFIFLMEAVKTVKVLYKTEYKTPIHKD